MNKRDDDAVERTNYGRKAGYERLNDVKGIARSRTDT